MINEAKAIELLNKAKIARQNAYAPYSHYRVGAALLTKNGKTYLGCNIENASLGATNCAERTALFSAVAEGVRDFEALAVVGGLHDTIDEAILPCGICFQVLSEFCAKDFPIILPQGDRFQVLTLAKLFPHAFSSHNLT